MTVEIGLQVEGIDRLLAGLKVAPQVLEVAEREAMTKSVLAVEAQVKANTPRVTGRLFSSIHGDVRSAPILSGRISTAVRYAGWVEGGRGPIAAKHMTRGGKPGFLRFRAGGRVFYRRFVGPAIGRHMFRIGLQEAAPQIHAAFRLVARRVAEAIKAGR